MGKSFPEFIEMIAETRPLAGSYFGGCASMKWDAWRVVRLLRQELDRLSPAPPRTVLDLGCGIGVYEREVGARWPSALVLGTDLSARNIAAARAYAPSACFLQIDAERIPLATASVDLAIAIEVMEHFLIPDRVAAELGRVVRPGGTLVVVVPLAPPVPFVRTLSRLATRFIGSKVVEEGQFKEHMRIYSRRTLTREFDAAWTVRRLVTFNIATFLIAALERLSAPLARRVAERHRRGMDRLDRVCGRLVYAKGMMILERNASA